MIGSRHAVQIFPSGALLMFAFVCPSMACGSDPRPIDVFPPPNTVVIQKISPSSGPLGTNVTIRGAGFTKTGNDVGFKNPGINFQGNDTAFLVGLSSDDGRTLRFALPDNQDVLLGACAFSQLATNEACPAIGLFLPSGVSQVFVVNAKGKSNEVTFTVPEGTPTPPSSTEDP